MVAVNTFHVLARREAGAWTATVTDANGAHTWGKGLRHLEQSVREAIALAEDIDDVDSFDLRWTYLTGDPGIDGESERLRAQREQVTRDAHELTNDTAAFIALLRSQGFSVRDAAAIAGVSPARAGQLASA